MVLNDRWEHILAEVGRTQQVMDMLCSSAAAEYRARGGEIFCAAGCGGCCTLAVSCSAAEALLIARTLEELQQKKLQMYVERLKEQIAALVDLKGYLRMHRRELGGCPFLEGDSCGIYPVRPISCRALLATKESSWCAVDFSDLPAAEKQIFIESLDPTATAFPLHYLAASRDAGEQLESLLSLQTLQEFGCSLYGSMPVLVHLFCTAIGNGTMDRGVDGLLATAAASGFDNPFLLQVERV